MLRHASILGVVSRRLTTLYSPALTQKSPLQPHLIHCVKIGSTASGYSFFRKMGDTQSGLSDAANADRPGKVKLSDEEWKKKLTPEEYKVARNHGTEPAWTGKLLENKGTGVYMCTCCGAELFSSANKFDSGSGWPSFDNVLGDKDVSGMPAVETVQDRSAGMVRTEVKCGKCDAHLGHVFNDGPNTTGKRYCINSVCLKFKPEDSDKQDNKQ